jgi:hypothetical protein
MDQVDLGVYPVRQQRNDTCWATMSVTDFTQGYDAGEGAGADPLAGH